MCVTGWLTLVANFGEEMANASSMMSRSVLKDMSNSPSVASKSMSCALNKSVAMTFANSTDWTHSIVTLATTDRSVFDSASLMHFVITPTIRCTPPQAMESLSSLHHKVISTTAFTNGSMISRYNSSPLFARKDASKSSVQQCTIALSSSNASVAFSQSSSGVSDFFFIFVFFNSDDTSFVRCSTSRRS